MTFSLMCTTQGGTGIPSMKRTMLNQLVMLTASQETDVEEPLRKQMWHSVPSSVIEWPKAWDLVPEFK